ncbi:hypothetical protein DRW03_19470 [Corallococcus sp. H22C18031201]|nr:hypothetical protein DRW03_19470 [Corallococcus sp. H22C18031201]
MAFREEPSLAEFRQLSREEKLQRIATLLGEAPPRREAEAATEVFALTDLQEAFSAGRLLGRASERVGCHFYLELNLPALDVARLRESWRVLLVRHGMLRAVILPEGRQRIRADMPRLDWTEYDQTGASARQLTEHLEHVREELSHKLYAPGDWPLYELRVTRASGGWGVVHLSMDEWIIDATSLRTLLAEWRDLYLHPGEALPPLGCSFEAHVAALRESEATHRYQEALSYWLRKLAPLPGGPSLSRQRSGAQGKTRVRRGASWDAASWARLRERAESWGVSPTALVLGAFTEALARDSEQKRFALVLTYAHRPPFHPHVERLVGPFTSTGLFVADEGATMSREERARAYQRQLWDDLDHAQVSSVRVLRALKAEGRLPAEVSFPVVFTSMLGLVGAAPEAGWLGNIGHMVSQTPQVLLDCQVGLQGDCLKVHWDAAQEAFGAGTLDALFLRFQAALAAWAELPVPQRHAARIAPPALLAVTAEPEREGDEFPLSDVQQAYLMGRGPSGGSDTSCQIYQEFDATDLDVPRLEAAWWAVVARHGMLRAVILSNGRQRIAASAKETAFPIVDLRDEPSQATRLDALRHEMSHTALPLGEGPLFDVRVSRLDVRRWRIHFTLDTLVADGASIARLFEEWFARYEAPALTLPGLAVNYRDVRIALQRFQETPLAAEQRAHWERRLTQAPGGLPPALGPASVASKTGVPTRTRRTGRVPEWARLKATAARWGVDPEVVALTAFCEALAQPAPEKSFTVVVVDWRRLAMHPEVDEVVGDFTSLGWLVREADPRRTFLERVLQNAERLEADARCRAVSGLSALRKLARESAGARGVFPVVFTRSLPRPPAKLPATVSAGVGISHTPQVLLDGIHFEVDGQLHFHWDAVAEVIPAENLERAFSTYQHLLTRLSTEPDWRRFAVTPVQGEVPVRETSLEPCLPDWLEAQVVRTPHAVAVRDGARTLTFQQLDEEAQRWARQLHDLGVRQDSLVAVMAERSVELVVALVAILKAGGAYLPLDPEYPEARLKLMAEDARPRVLLTQRRFDSALRFFEGPRLRLDEAPAPGGAPPSVPLNRGTSPDSLAYVLYTSGSTGTPKGCMVSHRAICNRLGWMQAAYPLSSTDRVLQKTPFTFDVSVWEFFWPLMTGAELVLAAPGGHRDSRYLARLIQEAEVTTCHFVPGMLGLFLEEPEAGRCASLRRVFTSGEALPSAVMARGLRTLSAELHNLYGPTEAAVDVTFWACQPRSDGKVPIGRAIANTRIVLLDAALREVPAGEVGELCIGGVNLARGYLGRPDLTGERFIPDPTGCELGARLYRTGDLARVLPDGELEFLGRADLQVKLRGNRIELGEVESALCAHPDVEDAATRVQDLTTPDPKLVGYVVTRAGRSFDLEGLRRHLRERLPAAMIPNVLAPLPALPRTRHGKLDRDALPWPVTVNSEAGLSREGTEEEIARFFRDALQCQDVSVTKDVFDLGATSFTIVRLAQWLEQTKGVAVPLETFLKNPTIRGIAQQVRGPERSPPRGGDSSALASEQVSFFSAEERQRFKDRALHLRHDVGALPSVSLGGLPDPANAYSRRGCPEHFLPGPIPREQFLAFLSLLRQGGSAEHPRYLYPSAGALYAVQVHVYVKPGAVEGLAEGTYYLHPVEGRLYRLSTESLGRNHHFYYNRPHFDGAAFALFLVARPEAIAPIYGEAALVLAALEAGYIGQLLMLRQAEFGLGLRPIGAVEVEQLRPALGLEASHVIVHSLLGGRVEYGDARAARSTATPSEVAIVGMAGRYPEAENLEQLWDNLSTGHRAIRPMPTGRRSEGASRPAGYLDHIDRFDHLFFGIAPAEARAMDPQERLLLTVMWEVLEDAGHSPESLKAVAPKVGVFVGVMWSDYQNVGQAEWSRSGQARAYSVHSAIANRISHVLDLRGPSVALDTSCSSALTALHLARESLLRGECDAALVGGVNLLAHGYHLSLLSSLGLVSEQGRSHAFGAEGSGWAAGEGVGAVLIRRLSDAERDRDCIHAVLQGTSVAHLGGGRGFGHPSPSAQAASIRAALAAAHVTPDSIGYVETAATGASMADAAEVSALGEVFAPRAEASGPCQLGSVKPNIGHLEAASGMSQLAKVLLQLRHEALAPTIDSEPQSPLIRLDPQVLTITRARIEWTRRPDAPLRALINAFGSTGSCAHAILDGYTPPPRAGSEAGPRVIVLSAATDARLQDVARRLAAHLATLAPARLPALADVALTLGQGRRGLRCRLAFVATTMDDLIATLRGIAAGERDSARVHHGVVAEPDATSLAGAGVSAEELARGWVQGQAIDWSRLLPREARRVPLPTYPFEETAHWIAEAPPAATTDLRAVRDFLAQVYAEEAEIPLARMEPHVRLERLGLNSYLVGKLNARLSREGLRSLSRTFFYERQTFEELALELVEKHGAEVRARLGLERAPGASVPVREPAGQEPPTSRMDEPIAIIGVAGRYPMAEDLEQLWENLAEGRDCIVEVPPQRWEVARYFDARRGQPGKTYCKWGGFLDDIDCFDPLFFGMTPRDAEWIDPQERLFLQTAWAAMEDAGYTRESLQRGTEGRVGVFVGVMYGEYQLLGTPGGNAPVGLAYGSIANRVSYCLDIHGPSFAVDTLCSSSLTAIHLAAESLRRGECAAAIAGGVNLSLHPSKYLLQAQAQMSASDGRCRSFGAGGDGFAPGEGVGAVLLKPLSRAEADGDVIHAVIRASALNHGGRTSGYTVPNPQAQAALIRQALSAGRVDPSSVSYVEAHGTGTSLGDPIEAAGLVQALGVPGRGRCAVGSIKSNIGHLEAAAGIAALSKVLLQLRHGRIAPSLYSETLNPQLPFEGTPFYVPQGLAEWPVVHDGEGRAAPRRAGISSFGAGGANAHLVVEEYRAPTTSRRSESPAPQLLVLSARTEERLRAHAGQWASFLARETGPSLMDLAHTSRVGREAQSCRMAVVARSRREAARALRAFSRGEPAPEVIRGGHPAGIVSGPGALEVERLASVGARWVSGAQFDWNETGWVDGARRVSLPTYPFERRRCWLPTPSPEAPSTEASPGETLVYEPRWLHAPAELRHDAIREPVLLLDVAEDSSRGWDRIFPEVIRVLPGRIFRRRDASTYEVDPSSKEDVHQLLWELVRHGRVPRVWVYRWASPALFPDGADEEAFFSLFWIAKALLVARQEHVDLVYVHSTVGGVATPRFAAMAAFARALRHEHPGFRFKSLELEPGVSSEAVAAHVAGVLSTLDSPQTEVRIAEGRRWEKVLSPRPLFAGASEAPRSSERPVYLVTGGLGGLGLLLAEHLVKTEGARLTLLSRAQPDDARARRVDALRQLGAEVLVLQADVSRREELAAAVATLKRHYGALHGVFHAAGSLRDSLLRDKTAEDAREVLRSKVAGIVALDEVTRDEPLRCFVCVSSLSAATGNPGQCDYAYANAFLDAFTLWREQERHAGRRPGVSRSILWPPWADGGMRVPPSWLEAVTRRTGLVLLPSAEALRVGTRLLREGPPVSVVVYGEAARLRALMEGPASVPAMSARLAPPPSAPPASAPPAQALPRNTRALLTRILVEDTKIAAEEWDRDAHFSEYGLDSLATTRLTRSLEAHFGPLPRTLFLDYTSVSDLGRYLASLRRVPEPSPGGRKRPRPEPRRVKVSEDEAIAIVGIDGRYPGAANPDALWANLRAGVRSITRVPASRWDADAFANIYCGSGGFLDGVEDFDPRFFHINPAEAKHLHPEERLLLQCVWSTLEGAGVELSRARAQRTGVFVGVTSLTYPLRGVERWVTHRDAPPDVSTYSLANRLSHFFNWVGPSLVVDTACSSSLVALHQACESLRRGECDTAVAAGANLYLHPSKYLRMCQNRLLATHPRGVFAHDGDGFIPGEGIGAVLLMPLRHALDARHTIHGVIRATGVAHSGRTTRFLSPSASAQAALLQRVVGASGLAVDALGYVELQAMGSPEADVVEWSALKQLFASRTSPVPCVLGSLKPNLGHLESASGMAQLTKVLLQLRHGELAPSHFAPTLHRDLALEGSPFQLQQALTPWARVDGAPRAALLSSLGAGGMHACAVIEEHLSRPSSRSTSPRPELIPLSARTEAQLREVATRLRDAVSTPDVSLADVAFTLQTGREGFAHRLALVADDPSDLRAGLEDFLAGRAQGARRVTGVVVRSSAPPAPEEQRAALQRRDLTSLASWWAQGASLDWEALHADAEPRRIPLPTYPFATQRCWSSEAEAGTVVSRYYDRFAADDEARAWESHLVFAPLRERAPDFSWLRTLVDREEHRVDYERVVAAQRDMKALLLSRLDAESQEDFRVLDLGCGLGTDLLGLATRYPKLRGHGHTISSKQAEVCQRRISREGLQERLTVWCRDSARGAYADTYDAILGFEVTFHIADKEGLFGLVSRHLKPDGRLLLVDVVTATVTEVDAAHLGQHTATQQQFAETLATHGLVIAEVIDASTSVGRFLDDPRFEENLASLSAAHPELRDAEPEHRGWHRFGVGLRMGLFRYVLLEVRKSNLPRAVLAERNVAAFLQASLYPGEAAPPQAPRASPREASEPGDIEPRLCALVARILEYRDGDLDADARFTELGLSSLQQVLLVEEVNRTFSARLKAHAIYSHSSIRELARHLSDATPRREARLPESPPTPTALPEAEPVASDDVAVIGFSARFPGARDATALWRNLIQGVDSVSEVPADRWPLAGFHDPSGGPGRSVSKWAGFLDEVDRFDPLFFNISPAEAEVMDPQQRLFLEACWHALEDAGQAGARLSGLRCGVFAGVTSSDYAYRVGAPQVSEQLAQAMLGNDHSILAARIAYHLDLKGPTMALNTACSSSLVAVHLACQSLLRGETDMMLAGGVSLYLDPTPFVIMSQAGILSPRGRCRTFAAGADGIAVGEGVGVVVLKRLDRALRDGDFIHGVIKGSGINQDGKTNGITAPSAESQSQLVRTVHERFGIHPETVTCIEAHGTGTLLGDPIEVSALTSAFGARTSRRGFCAIGSIKSNIGHTSAAAGVAGLIKVLLSLKHGMLPPTLHVIDENPHIDFEDSPFYVNRLPRPWVPEPRLGLRRAGVSAFGFSGTNCHLVVEQPPPRQTGEATTEVVLPLSAQTDEQLRELAVRLRERLSEVGNAGDLADIAFTLQTGRREMPRRLAVVGRSRRECQERLKAFLAGGGPVAGLHPRDTPQDLGEVPSSLGHALAVRWVRGEAVDWSALHAGASRRRMPLPGYPFARQRFWVESTSRGARSAPGPVTHDLRGDEFFLTDHVVDGQKLLPGVMALELARAACERELGTVSRIESWVWVKPVRHTGEPVSLAVRLSPVTGGADFELLDARTQDLYSHGRVVVGEVAPASSMRPEVDIHAVRQRATREILAGDLYALFAARGVAYGPRMRALARLHAGPEGALAEFAPLTFDEGPVLHPWWLDGALQTLLGLSAEVAGDASMLRVPFSLGALELFAPLTTTRFAYARPTPGSGTGLVSKFELALLDAEGRVLARMRELAVRALVAPPTRSAPAMGAAQALRGDALDVHVRTVVAQVLKLAPEQLDPAEPFEKYGLDSLLVTRVTRALAKDFGPLSMTLLFECQTLGELTRHLREHHGAAAARLVPPSPASEAPARIEAVPESKPVVADEGIAIIGLSGRYPQAPTLEDFWTNLREGRDSVVPVPAERWDVERYFHPDRTRLGSIYTRWGGFLEDVDKFDPLFFHIPPSDAGLLDPQERLFLETAWATVEDAGYTRARLGRRVGVFVGVMYGEYQFQGVEDLQAGGRIALNSSYASIANRVSYSLNFQGPSLAVDTMCSSALTAIHLACSALRQGECEAAIAGGVNLSLHPNKYLNLSQGQFGSTDGRCRSFGEGGDGYVPGEGVGAVLLKPLSRAVADGDRVLAVIRGSSLNHGGKTNGYTVPNPKAQAELIETALRRSGVDPRTIGFVEAHGTGTALGDPIEVAALTTAFRKFTDAQGFCGLGSVKSNIGHLESAAGIAALTKVLLQMRHRTLVPSLHSEPLNPHIDFRPTPFRVQRTVEPWLPVMSQGASPAHGLRAAISSFGAGGSNAHLVIEEWLPPTRPDERPEPRGAWVIPVSARDDERLDAAIRRLREHLQGEGASLRLDDLAHTLRVGREPMAARWACVATSREALLDALSARLDKRPEQPVREEHAEWAVQAERWVRGGELPPEAVASTGRVVALPTYPFARERHWFVPTGTKQSEETPRLGWRLDHASAGVRGHVVAGRAVVPAATLLERVHALVSPGRGPVRLRNVALIEPVDVTGESRDLEVRRTDIPEEESESFEVVSVRSAGEEPRLHVQGRLQLTGNAISGEVEPLDVSAIRARLGASLRGSELYARYRDAGIDYGPPFQVIHALWSGPGEVLAQLIATTDDTGGPPAVLDGAFQAVLGIFLSAPESAGGPAVPFAIGDVEFMGPLPSRGWAHVRYAPHADGANPLHAFDLCVSDDSGRVLVRVSKLVSRPMATAQQGTFYFRPEWRAVAQTSSSHASPRRTTLLFDTVEDLRSAWPHPDRVVLVRPGTGFRKIDRHHYELEPGSESDASRLLDALDADALAPECMLHLWPYRAKLEAGDLDSALSLGFRASFSLLRAWTRRRDKRAVRWLSVCQEAASPVFAGLSAFLRAIALEDTALHGGLLSVHRAPEASAADLVRLLLAETNAPEPDVLIDNDVRKVLRLAPIPRPESSSALPLRNRGRYLVAGGLGGLGGIVATFLARQFKARLLLCGRSPLDAKGEESLRRLRAVGAEVHHVTVDLGVAEDCVRLASEAQRLLGGLDGIFQSAGVQRDGLLRTQSLEQAEAVLRPKVHGTVNLDAAFARVPLEFFVLFSSLAGVMGNAGQGAYSFANGVLDGFASWREALRSRGERSGRTVSINWPLWDAGGMRLADEERHWLKERLGLTPLSSSDGLVALAEALRLMHPRVLVLSGDRARVNALLGVDRDAGSAVASAPAAEPAPWRAATDAPAATWVARIEQWLGALLRAELQLGARPLRGEVPFEEYGLDSVRALRLTRALEAELGELTKTLFYEYPSLRALAAHLAEHHRERLARKLAGQEAARAPSPRHREPPRDVPTPPAQSGGERGVGEIAIIGVAGRYPGASDLETFWTNLREGKDSITEVPAKRWPRSESGPLEWGGFLDGVDEFDPLLFNISPREAEWMDPQERLFLQTAWHVIESAGYTRARLGRDVGVYVGVMNSEYQLHGVGRDGAGRGRAISGSYAAIANRVSYFFDFAGPSIALDTMCSSSLVALHLACEALRSGDIALAIAGGVNVSVHPQKYVNLGSGQFLSSDGRCRSFGAGGDGYVPGEGVGAVLLKPLAHAMRDGDPILGVIQGSAINHGGRVNGYTVPNPQAQADVITRALARAGVSAADIGYLEAHGTGTSLGDPIEIAGLDKVFRQAGAMPGSCAIGSVKSNIGHLEAAAGIAGLTKLLLQLRHRELVPSLHARSLNPNIRFESSTFSVQRTLAPWALRAHQSRRLAGLSAFGAGGVNAHVVIAEHVAPERAPLALSGPVPVVFSARSAASLQGAVKDLLRFLRATPVPLVDLALTLGRGREAMEHRLVVLASDLVELLPRLEQVAAGSQGQGIHRGRVPLERETRARGDGLSLDELARLWTTEMDFDWSTLPQFDGGRVVPLPGYHFDTRRYWVSAAAAEPRVSVVPPPREPDDEEALALLRKLSLGALTVDEVDARMNAEPKR